MGNKVKETILKAGTQGSVRAMAHSLALQIFLISNFLNFTWLHVLISFSHLSKNLLPLILSLDLSSARRVQFVNVPMWVGKGSPGKSAGLIVSDSDVSLLHDTNHILTTTQQNIADTYLAVSSCQLGFTGSASGKEPTCQCRRLRRLELDPWFRKIPWRRAWQPTPVFLPRKSNGKKKVPQTY